MNRSDMSLVPTTALCEMLNPETECRRSSRHGVCGEDQKPGRGEGRANANLARRLLTGICFWTGLTPELSRAALRPWASENHSTCTRPRSGLGLNELLGANPRISSGQSMGHRRGSRNQSPYQSGAGYPWSKLFQALVRYRLHKRF